MTRNVFCSLMKSLHVTNNHSILSKSRMVFEAIDAVYFCVNIDYNLSLS